MMGMIRLWMRRTFMSLRFRRFVLFLGSRSAETCGVSRRLPLMELFKYRLRNCDMAARHTYGTEGNDYMNSPYDMEVTIKGTVVS